MLINYGKNYREWTGNNLATPCRTPTTQPRADMDDSDCESEIHQSSCEGDVRANDMSPTDSKEREILTTFISKSCGCTLGIGKQPCSKQFTREQITLSWNNCLEMTRAEQI